MAIAPLWDTESADWSGDLYGASWPRPAFPLVADDEAAAPAVAPPPGAPPAGAPPAVRRQPALLPSVPVAPVSAAPICVPPATAVPMGLDVTARRSRRAVLQRRRRIVALATVVAGLVCGLSLPFAAVGGSTPAVRPGSHAGVAGGTVYVVRPGDTLWAIAARFDAGGDPRPLAEALAKETGSAVVVPGERLSIP